jgi:hypothetical protein
LEEKGVEHQQILEDDANNKAMSKNGGVKNLPYMNDEKVKTHKGKTI